MGGGDGPDGAVLDVAQDHVAAPSVVAVRGGGVGGITNGTAGTPNTGGGGGGTGNTGVGGSGGTGIVIIRYPI